MTASMRLDGRVAVVTGASSGLGAATARALAELGARVAVTARRVERLEALATEIDGVALECDLTDRTAVASLIPRVVERLGPPQILVNAAGTLVNDQPAEVEPLDGIDTTLQLNLVAPLMLCQAVHPHMVAAGSGSIVNISSISGHVGVPGIPQASYAATKSGLEGMTTELAAQWAKDRIRVNAVAPGFFRSEVTESLFESESGQRWLARNQLLPDMGTADDITGAIAWLVGDAASFVTGQTLVVDGGWTSR